MVHAPPEVPEVPHADLRVVDLVAVRITLVQVLSSTAVLTGLLLALTGNRVVPFVPGFALLLGWPELYGSVLAGSGGVVLATAWRRAHLIAGVAAYVAAAMYAVLVGGFLLLWWEWLRGHIGYFPPYPAAVYSGLAGMHIVHASVEIRAWRHERARVSRARIRRRVRRILDDGEVP